jgi:hypothetical protein
MSFAMQPAQFPNGGWPEANERAPGSDQTYPRGTPVTWDTSSQELDVHALAATVTNILGVSNEGVTAGTADNPSGNVSFTYAARSNVFVAKLTNNSGVVATADTANINVEYGLVIVGSGATAWWAVDESDTTHKVVEVIGIDTDRNVVFFKFIESAIQQP